ncbi:MAG: preprotein translocase subunit YajC [Bacteroidales bacterium]|nr:preprotein translocase subunit YajC [Bacteroidales bacterium]
MTHLSFILQAQAGAPAGSGASMWIMLALIFLVMWLFMIRPQRKQQKELEKFRNGLKKGDKVVTAGGIYGTVAEVKDNFLFILVDKDVKIKVAKASVQADYSEGTAPAAVPAASSDKKADEPKAE